ncbi:MAG: DUF6155 family protein [Cyanobacteria bacterium P01_E01_bin.42]
MAQKNLTLTTLKKHLKSASKEELIDDISELFKRFSAVKDFYTVKLSPQGDKEVIDKYKKTIEDEFFPKRGFGKARLSVAKKAISDYQKISASPAMLIDIMLFYVEQGVRYTNAYGDINEPFYDSMENMYEKAVKKIGSEGLHGVFHKRCQKIVDETSDIGWGFHDMLAQIYYLGFEQ